MATTYGTTSRASSTDYDMSLWYDSKYYKLGMLTMLLVAIYSGSGTKGRLHTHMVWTRWNRNLTRYGWDCGVFT